MKAEEIITIGIVAVATFSVLDLFAPSIGSSVRSGAGQSIGLNLLRWCLALCRQWDVVSKSVTDMPRYIVAPSLTPPLCSSRLPSPS